MKLKQILPIIISILIISSPKALATSNDFNTSLSVSNTIVPAGTTVVSTITVTNTDKDYGADVAISYDGQSISSYYLPAGQSEVITHNVLINETTNILYTVYASHGPDISKTKNTNAVIVYIEQPTTPTPTNTPIPAPTDTPTPAPEITTGIIAETTEQIDVFIADDNIGWGTLVARPDPPEEVFDNLFGKSLGSWLGINPAYAATENYTDTMREVHRIRRIIASLFVLLILAILTSITILVTKSAQNKSI